MSIFAIITMILNALSTLIPQIASGCGTPPAPTPVPPTGGTFTGIDPACPTLNSYALAIAADLCGEESHVLQAKMASAPTHTFKKLGIKATVSPVAATAICQHPNRLQMIRATRTIQGVVGSTVLPPGATYQDVAAAIQDKAASLTADGKDMTAAYAELGISYQ